MKNQDQVILREIQKNTHMGLEAIDALMPRVRDEHFARELANESMMYGNYYEKATNELLKEENRLYKDVKGKDMMLRMGIWMQTFKDSSTSHMAELMIQGANRGITDMYKILNHNKHANGNISAMANELMDMEEKTITMLRDYL